MNRILIATILGLATAGGASAMTSPTTLSNVAKSRAEHILPNASFANLTAKQVVRIEGLLSGGQDLTDSEFRQRLETALWRPSIKKQETRGQHFAGPFALLCRRVQSFI
jgi:hypothetical protein